MNKHIKQILSFSIALLAATSAASSKTITLKVDDEKGRDSVSFTSDAPLELIEGHTNKIKGAIQMDDSLDLSKKPLYASFTVNLSSIDTGIALRNEHMRNNFLETPKYPEATFKLTSLQQPVVLKPGQKTHLLAVGQFTVHGKTVTKTVPVDLTYYKPCALTEQKRANCDLLQLSATFPVAFKDHDIKRPELVFQKLADTVDVKVSATAYLPEANGGH